MASASRLLPPVLPPAAPLHRPRDRVPVPHLQCRASSAAVPANGGTALQLRCRASSADVSASGGAALLDRGGAAVAVREFVTLDELRAAVNLRVRTFNEYSADTYGAEDHRKALADREFEALQNRISGKAINFRRVSCINATVPLSSLMSAEELWSTCKFVEDGEERVVVGSLDLNQCLWLPDELTGERPGANEGNNTRAYLSNVCVAKELQRNGLGYVLVDKSKKLAREWGITDLYVHVAIDNVGGQKLYKKSGFVYESEEPAWKARFLGRPRRLLLWLDMSEKPL